MNAIDSSVVTMAAMQAKRLRETQRHTYISIRVRSQTYIDVLFIDLVKD
jgi:hypothetical protein